MTRTTASLQKMITKPTKWQYRLEKQIPKKPDIEGDGYDPDGNLVYDTWICPTCGVSYEIDYDKYDYCPACGQAIDQSEGE
jgi:rubrerythrin